MQVCTYVMKVGYRCIHDMCKELSEFMDKHHFKSLADFKGHSLQYFTTHYDLVARQAEARKAKAAASKDGKAIRADSEWKGDEFVKQTDALARG